MEEPSDSSRQRAPDLTTFLVTSYEHLRLKTPLISRIHRARLMLHKSATVQIELFDLQAQKVVDTKLQNNLLRGPTGRKIAQTISNGESFELWKIVETKTHRPHLFWDLDQVTTVKDGIILHIKALEFLQSSYLNEMAIRVESCGVNNYRHHIVIKKAGLVILDQTIDACYPWIFLKETLGRVDTLKKDCSIYRNILENCPPGCEVSYTNGFISRTWLSSGRKESIPANLTHLRSNMLNSFEDERHLYWTPNTWTWLIKNLKSKPLGEASDEKVLPETLIHFSVTELFRSFREMEQNMKKCFTYLGSLKEQIPEGEYNEAIQSLLRQFQQYFRWLYDNLNDKITENGTKTYSYEHLAQQYPYSLNGRRQSKHRRFYETLAHMQELKSAFADKSTTMATWQQLLRRVPRALFYAGSGLRDGADKVVYQWVKTELRALCSEIVLKNKNPSTNLEGRLSAVRLNNLAAWLFSHHRQPQLKVMQYHKWVASNKLKEICQRQNNQGFLLKHKSCLQAFSSSGVEVIPTKSPQRSKLHTWETKSSSREAAKEISQMGSLGDHIGFILKDWFTYLNSLVVCNQHSLAFEKNPRITRFTTSLRRPLQNAWITASMILVRFNHSYYSVPRDPLVVVLQSDLNNEAVWDSEAIQQQNKELELLGTKVSVVQTKATAFKSVREFTVDLEYIKSKILAKYALQAEDFTGVLELSAAFGYTILFRIRNHTRNDYYYFLGRWSPSLCQVVLDFDKYFQTPSADFQGEVFFRVRESLVAVVLLYQKPIYKMFAFSDSSRLSTWIEPSGNTALLKNLLQGSYSQEQTHQKLVLHSSCDNLLWFSFVNQQNRLGAQIHNNRTKPKSSFGDGKMLLAEAQPVNNETSIRIKIQQFKITL